MVSWLFGFLSAIVIFYFIKNNLKISSLPGIKYDDGKIRWDLVPWDVIEKIAEVYTFGAQKYGPNKWIGVEENRYFAALMRHLVARERGELLDPESGLFHSTHATWNCMTLLWHDLNDKNN
jgi:hypothetical protein